MKQIQSLFIQWANQLKTCDRRHHYYQ